MQLVITEPAEHDLGDIVDYIASDNPDAAANVYKKIVVAANRLIDFPAMGRSGWLPGTRELVIPNLPYIVVYQVDATRDTVTILAVFHGARDLVHALAERGKASKTPSRDHSRK